MRCLSQLQVPLRQRFKRPQRRFLTFEEPLMKPRGFFLHPLECPQVFLNQCQSRCLARRCHRSTLHLDLASTRLSTFDSRPLIDVRHAVRIGFEYAALRGHDMALRGSDILKVIPRTGGRLRGTRRDLGSLERSHHLGTRRDGGAWLHVVGSRNRNAQPVRATCFGGTAAVRIPWGPVD